MRPVVPTLALVPPLRRRGVRLLLLAWILAALSAVGRAWAGPQDAPLVIGCNDNHPPYKFRNDAGEADGLLIDLWRRWSEATGRPVVFRTAPFQKTLDLLRSGGIDVHAGLFASPGRRRWLAFSNPLLPVRYFLYTHASLPVLHDLSRALPYRIGVPEGYTRELVAARLPGAALAVYADYPLLFQAALRGDIRAFVAPELNLAYYLNRRRLPNPFHADRDAPVYAQDYRAAVLRDRVALIRAIDEGMARIDPSVVAALERKWLGRVLDLEADQVVVALPSDRPPLAMLDPQGHPVGILVEVWRRWARQTGLRIRFAVDANSRLRDLVRRGLADILGASAGPAAGLEDAGLVYRVELGLFAPAGSPLHTAEDLDRHLVACVEDAFCARFRQSHPGVRTVTAPGYGAVFSLLERGEAAAVVDAVPVFTDLLHRQGRQDLFVRLAGFADEAALDCAVAPERTALADTVRRGMAALSLAAYAEWERAWLARPEQGWAHRRLARPQDGGQGGLRLEKPLQDFLQDHRNLRVGVDPEQYPYTFLDGGRRPQGLCLDLLAALAEIAGVRLTPVVAPDWRETVRLAGERRIDLLPCVTPGKAAEAGMTAAEPALARFQRALVTRTDHPFVAAVDDLRGARLVVRRGAAAEGYLQRHGVTEILTRPTYAEALTLVSQGRADGFVGNLAAAGHWIRKRQLDNLKVAAVLPRGTIGLHLAVRNDLAPLGAIFTRAMAALDRDREDRIRRRWVRLPYEQGVPPRKVARYLLQVAGGALVLIALSLLWAYRLKREVRQRQEAERQLARANAHLQSLDRLKSLFIATMSHELRTPLNSIIGFSGVLLQGLSGPLSDRQRDQIGRVHRAAKHLLALISDIIDISKIEAGRIDIFLEPVDLGELLDECAVACQQYLEDDPDRLVIERPEGLVLGTDRKRLLQCLINLVSNALKYSSEGVVRVTVEAEGDEVRIRVRDQGVGIAAADLERIFEPFERIDNSLRVKAGGTGLGLYLTRKLAEDFLDGAIEVASTPGEGSTFTLRLPRNHAKMESSGASG